MTNNKSVSLFNSFDLIIEVVLSFLLKWCSQRHWCSFDSLWSLHANWSTVWIYFQSTRSIYQWVDSWLWVMSMSRTHPVSYMPCIPHIPNMPYISHIQYIPYISYVHDGHPLDVCNCSVLLFILWYNNLLPIWIANHCKSF